MSELEAESLRAELIRRFGDAEAPLDDDTFDDLARRVFTRNYHAVPAYAGYCRARSRTPDDLDHWTRIPAVPTAAFREVTLRADDLPTARVFRTSGTTRGRERRGEHHVADLDLYRASLRSTFRAFLLPDDAPLRFLSLMPPSQALPDSSLAFMISDVMGAFGGPGSAAHADAAGVDFTALEKAVELASGEGQPVLLLGTSSAFIHWLDRLENVGRSFSLPSGSRLMDTGGHKGKGRQVEPSRLRDLYGQWLGVPAHRCVNEYGMTELLSQRYDNDLRSNHRGQHRPARKVGPGWLRTLAVDPETLDPVPPGESGILRHVDLANLDSVAAVQTEDVGRVDETGLVLEGRATGAPPRGCSLAMDLLLEGRDG